jgi:hypothetical protein
VLQALYNLSDDQAEYQLRDRLSLRCKIGMTNLVYNMRRFVCLERVNGVVGRVSEWRKVTSQKPGGNFRQPQSQAEDRTIWPCRDHERRSSYHRRIFFEVP